MWYTYFRPIKTKQYNTMYSGDEADQKEYRLRWKMRRSRSLSWFNSCNLEKFPVYGNKKSWKGLSKREKQYERWLTK